LTPDLSKEDAANSSSPCIALIYGFAAREHMQRNLLRWLRESGYANTTLYGHLQAIRIADDLQAASVKGQNIVVIGYSQGGLEAVRVAHELDKRGVKIALLVTIAGGGGGRLFPHRWADDPRTIPANVARCFNYFSENDFLGSDSPLEKNLAVPVSNKQYIENILFAKKDRVSHIAITKCYPVDKVCPRVSEKLLNRLQSELATLQQDRP
jgi:pimeloyl-ACP methyl ester carboxylesterase